MTISKDWIADAAREIVDADLRTGIGGQYRDSAEREAREIIAKHCPFKPDTAYVPVEEVEKAYDRGHKEGYDACADADEVDDHGDQR
jgi:hypothetical protein